MSAAPLAAVPALRRACACGGTPGPTGECEACRQKRVAVQRSARSAAPMLAPPIVHDVLRSAGSPLDAGTRGELEPRFRHSFADVRVHADGRAAESARAVGAHAYAVGPHLVFGAGRYAPGSAEGRRLIAHELAHVVQQRGAAASLQPKLELGAEDDAAEREADRAAEAAARGAALPAIRLRGAGVQRQVPDAGDAGTAMDAGAAPADAGAEPQAAQSADGGATSGSPPAAAPPPCSPTAFTRAAYLAQPGTSTRDFGLTTLSGTVTVPAVRTTPVHGGVRLEETDAALPPLTSVFTGADTFIEDTVTFVQQDGGCRTGRYPLRWTIDGPGAASIRTGETEHCADFRYAFAISLRRYADVVNGLARSRRVFPGAAAAAAAVTRAVGVPPARWMEVFECLAGRTSRRDGARGARGWHTPRPRMVPPQQGRGCAFAEAIVGASSLPEVGRHASPTIIQGCGEASPP